MGKPRHFDPVIYRIVMSNPIPVKLMKNLENAPYEILTPHQIRILSKLAEGKTYKEIASEFYVSENTVKSNIVLIYRRLNVHRRTEAVNRARELGIL